MAPVHYLGAAGEHLAASYFLAEGTPVYFPLAQSGWCDLVIQRPHGFKSVQVKTCGTDGNAVRVRRLGSNGSMVPADRYDILVVVNKHRLWEIPAPALGARDDILLKPQDTTDWWNQFRKV